MKGYIDNLGWIHCPSCKSKTHTKVLANTLMRRFPLFCPKCGRESIINIEQLNMSIAEPDARRRADNI